jgi:hypothetical protein
VAAPAGARTGHPELPDIEPGGVVARSATPDGHEAKVLRDGRVVVCSDSCGPILAEFRVELDADPLLRASVEARAREIDAMTNAQAKADTTARLRSELQTVRDSRAAGPVLRPGQEEMLARLLRRFEREGLSRAEVLRLLGLNSEAELRTLVAGARTETQLQRVLARRAEEMGVAARAEARRAARSDEPLVDEGFDEASRTLSASDLRALARSKSPLPTTVERRMLQDVVDDVSVRLMLDPEEAVRYLSVGERAAVAESPRLTAMYFGNAVERRVALELADAPELARFLHTPQRPFVSTPDIGGPIGRRRPRAYDVTSERGVEAHEERSYAPFTKWVTYPSLPPGWRFPR